MPCAAKGLTQARMGRDEVRLLCLLKPCSSKVTMAIMPAHKKPTPLRHCEFCGTKLERKPLPRGGLEYLIHFNRRKYCGRVCMARAFDARHSAVVGPSTARYHARKIVPPGPCSRCGKPKAKDVHHHDENYLNNSPSNLERICRSCHVRGHRPKSSCTICGALAKALGFCDKHYQRFKRYGDPLMYRGQRQQTQ